MVRIPAAASPILAHSWWTVRDNHRKALPREITAVVSDFPNIIDGVQSGLLLRKDRAAAFDSGEIPLECRADCCGVIAIAPDSEEYDGVVLEEAMVVQVAGVLRPEPSAGCFSSQRQCLGPFGISWIR
jgi:hypothetical protein